jgi:hypothetical protein
MEEMDMGLKGLKRLRRLKGLKGLKVILKPFQQAEGRLQPLQLEYAPLTLLD